MTSNRDNHHAVSAKSVRSGAEYLQKSSGWGGCGTGHTSGLLICYVQIPDGDGTLYMTIKYQKGDAISPYKFVAPWEFN